MNKKVIFIIIMVLFVAIYVLWSQRQERLEEQRQQEFNQQAEQEQIPYSACTYAVERTYKTNLNDLNLVGLSKEKIDEKLVQYQEQYDRQSFECHKQYPAAAATRIGQEALNQANELRNRNYAK